ncbi:MAG TPA: ABC transporter substrate-binding protein [Acidimicrobiales bacterium]
MDSAPWKTRITALGMVALVAVTAMACSSTNSSSTATTAGAGNSGGSSGRAIPQSAFSDHTGITSNSIHVGNVSTLAIGGLFKGALVGTQAYAAYVNSQGGVNGRHIVVDSSDDNYTGTGNKQGTQAAITNDAALVGGFSTFDSFGGTVLAQNPGVPDVTQVLDLSTNALPNVYSPAPLEGGWQEGALQYFKTKFGSAPLQKVGTLVANLPSPAKDWAGEKYVMEKVGYKVIYEQTYGETQFDFTPNVVAMKDAGVKVLFVDQMAEVYASALLKNLVQQDFHPIVVLGAATYSTALIPAAGGPAAVNGSYFDQNASLYLGEDQAAIPAVGTFLHWVQVVSPGFKPDLFTLYAWNSASLFAQALKNAGTDPSRGSILQALSKITSYNGNNIITTSNPTARTTSNCYLVGRVVNSQWQRQDDPPVNSSTNGYRCDYQYVTPPK